MGQAYNIARSANMELSSTDGQRIGPPWKYRNGETVASLNSRFSVNMCFINRTSFTVKVFWVNFAGAEVSYGEMKPGETSLLYTYLSHPWVFRNKDKEEQVLAVNGKMVAWPSQHHTFAEIKEPATLSWSPVTHASDFRARVPSFAQDVRNLLRACYADRRPPSVGGTAGRAAGRSTREGCSAGAAAKEATSTFAGCCGANSLWTWRAPRESSSSPQPTWAKRLSATAAKYAAAYGYSFTVDPVSTSASKQIKRSPLRPDLSHSRQSQPSEPSQQLHRQQPQPQHHVNLLAQLPFELVLEIIKHMAPPLPEIQPMQLDEVEMLPEDVSPERGPLAYLAARMLGPVAPQPPTVDPAAWFAAANGVGPGPAAAAVAAAAAGGGGGNAVAAVGGPAAQIIAAAAGPVVPGPLALGAVAPVFPVQLLVGENGAPQVQGLGVGNAPQLLLPPFAPVGVEPAQPPGEEEQAGDGPPAEAAEPEAAAPPDVRATHGSEVAELMRYFQALALANAAYAHVNAMYQRQQAQVGVLLARIVAEEQARQRQLQQHLAAAAAGSMVPPQVAAAAAAVAVAPQGAPVIQEAQEMVAGGWPQLPALLAEDEEMEEVVEGVDEEAMLEEVAEAGGPLVLQQVLPGAVAAAAHVAYGLAAGGREIEEEQEEGSGMGVAAGGSGVVVLEQFYSAPEGSIGDSENNDGHMAD